jgi:DNA-directed RNA polymerase specialized sigma24 family protein
MSDQERWGRGDRRIGQRDGVPLLTVPLFRRHYDAQRTDVEIAAITGVSLTTVELLRLSLDLPAHTRPDPDLPTRLAADRRRRATAIEGQDDAYQHWYDLGLIDAEIARQTGVTRAAVYEWRQGRKLPAHRSTPSTRECWRYYVRGFTDAEISAVTGVKEKTVAHWRYRYGLPAISRLHAQTTASGEEVVGNELPDYRKWYDLGYNDAEIAAAVNRTVSGVQTWRRRRQLPSNNGRGRPAAAATHVPVEERAAPRRLVPRAVQPTRPVRGTARTRRAPDDDEGDGERVS